MTTNQVTGQFLTPDEIREIVTYVHAHRETAGPFDVAVNGELPADPHERTEMIQRYSEAGATWWIELEAPGQSFEEYRERIRQGSPRYE